MNPILKLLLDGVISYLNAHPDQIEGLVQALLGWLVQEGEKALNAAKAA